MKLILDGNELMYPENFLKLVVTWSRYDSLIDLKEDSGRGLVPFSREKLSYYNIRSKKDFPKKGEEFFSSEKSKTIDELLTRGHYVMDTNMPNPEKTALTFYFLTRAIKLKFHKYPFTINEEKGYAPEKLIEVVKA